MAKVSRTPQKPIQLTLVSTIYVSRLLRTVAHVRSISTGRTVSISEVFRDLVTAASDNLEQEVATVIGAEKAAELRAVREGEAGPS